MRRRLPPPPSARVRPSGLYARLSTPPGSDRQLSNLLVGPGVEEEEPAGVIADRERRPVRAEGDRPEERVVRAVHDPDRRRSAPEGGEQVAAGLGRVVDRDRLAGEQERTVEILLDERLGAEALGELNGLGVARLGGGVVRLATLDDGEDAARDCGSEEDARHR